MTKAQLSRHFVQQIQEDIVAQLKAQINQQNLDIKPIVEDSKKWQKDLTELQTEVKRVHQLYKSRKRDYEQHAVLNVIFEICSEYTDDRRQKQAIRANQAYQEVSDLEKQYEQIVKDLNIYIDREYKRISECLNRFQQQELERQFMIKDTLVRNIIYETSLTKNVTYDFEKFAERVQDLDPESRVKEFAVQNQTDEPLYKEYHKQQSFISKTLWEIHIKNEFYFFKSKFQQIVQDHLSEKLEQVENEDEQEKQNPDIIQMCNLLDSIWKQSEPLNEEQAGQVILEKYYQLVAEFQDIKKRRIVPIYLNKKRGDGESILEPQQLLNLQQIILLLLDACQKAKECGTVRNLMPITFSFSAKDKQQLQSLVTGHKIWQNRDFWETVIIESIYEQFTYNKPKRPNMDYGNIQIISQLIEREKNSILTILSQISQNMLMFQFKVDHTKDIMTKFCSFFQLNQEIAKDLMVSRLLKIKMAVECFEANK